MAKRSPGRGRLFPLLALALAGVSAACGSRASTPTDEIVCGSAGEVLWLPPAAPTLEGCTRCLGTVHLPDAVAPDALAPLKDLVAVEGSFTIFRNHALNDLRGLERLARVAARFSIRLDDSAGFSDVPGEFTSVDGVGALREVGTLEISSNPWLERLDGFATLDVVHGDVTITDNLKLPQAEIDTLLRRVRVEGTVTVSGNAP
jgi:hypothetical protein